MKETRVASMQIQGAGEMTEAQRKDIAQWLRDHAKHLLKHGDNYAKRFRAGFIYTSKAKR